MQHDICDQGHDALLQSTLSCHIADIYLLHQAAWSSQISKWHQILICQYKIPVNTSYILFHSQFMYYHTFLSLYRLHCDIQQMDVVSLASINSPCCSLYSTTILFFFLTIQHLTPTQFHAI